VDSLKARLGQAPYDSPLTQPGCSLPNMIPIGFFGDISEAIFGFVNIISSIFFLDKIENNKKNNIYLLEYIMTTIQIFFIIN